MKDKTAVLIAMIESAHTVGHRCKNVFYAFYYFYKKRVF